MAGIRSATGAERVTTGATTPSGAGAVAPVTDGGASWAVGGLASAAFGLPALGFALGPNFSRTEPHRWQDVGPEADFSKTAYTQKIIDLVANVGDSGKTTIYVRKYDPAVDGKKNSDLPYVAISNRCMHLGCPVRFVPAASRFICPCHGGVYDVRGMVTGGPPVRPLDRYYTRLSRSSGLVEIGRGRFGSRAFFTEAGITELRALLQDRRAMDPERFGHLCREFGLDAGEVATRG